MVSTGTSSSQAIRARLGHPIIDSDGHTLEASPLLPGAERIDAFGEKGESARPVRIGRQVLVPTTEGVRVYDLDDLGAAPELLDRPSGLPPPMSLYAIRDGIVALSPHPLDESRMYVECWAARP